ncbi:insulinase family protein [Thalassotalea sp. LPB0316]|uniref:insulinase family protein n=1 Tax=Thalassotalea sp. LPB0316 TaxID=2769490 RepID=UPI001868E54E|nr:insulinase family protein [Thalassotalea sp. LPB0316]QOL24449.1 insulinase family protein [Thalassotalea sp. LPB0316]
MIKSPNDNKNYHSLTLANGLRVLLIENTESQKAAAALAVNVGHFSDPIDRQGMAHFLEHMLFLGTKHFPDGNEYQQFIAKNGGHHNAWTATEHTCYFLDIFYQQFEAALERFSDFFINPLLSQSFIEKERQNIDAEFKLKLKDDIRRLYDVHKETINQQHPFSQFSVGNIDTLADRENSNVRDELVSFYQRHYYAQNMTLALEGPIPLAELERLATQYFSPIVSNNAPKAEIAQPIYQKQHQGIKIDVCPVKDDRQLIVSFAMPCLDGYYQHKPEALIAYLLGHEGPGSLLSYLKQQHWALRLSAGSGIHGSNFKDFNISISLTEKGEAHVDEIIAACFSYIELLKAKPIDEIYFDEKKAIASLSFNFQEQVKPIESVSHLVMNMHYYPSEHYIYGDYIMAAMNHQYLSEILAYLSPDNLRVMHVSKQLNFDKTSQWYQVPYKVSAFNEQQKTLWQNPPELAPLHLPEKNPYIVKAPEIVVKEKEQTQPEIINKENGLTVWFKQDQSFNIPKGYIYLNIDSPYCVSSDETIAMTRLFVNLFTDNVTEAHYNAELAGMHYHLYPHQSGMTLQISGLSEKQPLLLEKLLHSLTNQVFCQDKFNLFKQQLIKHIKNTQDSKSISQLFSAVSSLLQPQKLDAEAYIKALENVAFEHFQQFYLRLFEKIYLELFIHGNWQRSHAEEITTVVKTAFNGSTHDNAQQEIPVIDTQGAGTLTHFLTLHEHDHATIVYFNFADKSVTTMAYAMIVSQLLSPHFFEQMRTEKQFGYLVGVGYVPTGYYPGMALYIQSPHTNSIKLLEAIEQFVSTSNSLISQLTEQEWYALRSGLAGQLLEKDATLRIKSQRFWGSITSHDTEFNNKAKLINAISNMELDEIKAFVSERLLDESGQNIAADHICLMTAKDLDLSVLSNTDRDLQEVSKKLQKTGKIKF